ncbi:MAG: hypothetical protein KA790_13910, partial [Ottowia sp.]|nr:hypothetical protein [Ottowia sp.]
MTGFGVRALPRQQPECCSAVKSRASRTACAIAHSELGRNPPGFVTDARMNAPATLNQLMASADTAPRLREIPYNYTS